MEKEKHTLFVLSFLLNFLTAAKSLSFSLHQIRRSHTRFLRLTDRQLVPVQDHSALRRVRIGRDNRHLVLLGEEVNRDIHKGHCDTVREVFDTHLDEIHLGVVPQDVEAREDAEAAALDIEGDELEGRLGEAGGLEGMELSVDGLNGSVAHDDVGVEERAVGGGELAEVDGDGDIREVLGEEAAADDALGSGQGQAVGAAERGAGAADGAAETGEGAGLVGAVAGAGVLLGAEEEELGQVEEVVVLLEGGLLDEVEDGVAGGDDGGGGVLAGDGLDLDSADGDGGGALSLLAVDDDAVGGRRGDAADRRDDSDEEEEDVVHHS